MISKWTGILLGHELHEREQQHRSASQRRKAGIQIEKHLGEFG
ncbi:MAG: hypothetical protein M0003_11065 [Acidithiobacillus sp.]|nr:hypothetical protein [Acidithiobacillus sp.]